MKPFLIGVTSILVRSRVLRFQFPSSGPVVYFSRARSPILTEDFPAFPGIHGPLHVYMS